LQPQVIIKLILKLLKKLKKNLFFKVYMFQDDVI